MIKENEYTKEDIQDLESEYAEIIEQSRARESRSVLFDVEMLRKKNSKLAPVRQLSLDGELITEYKSFHEASKFTGISVQNIWGSFKDDRNEAGGFKWIYIN